MAEEKPDVELISINDDLIQRATALFRPTWQVLLL